MYTALRATSRTLAKFLETKFQADPLLSGFFGGGGSSSSVTANLECNGKTLTLPKQTLMFYEISGNGSYKKDTVNVNYTVMSAFDTIMCTTQLIRKP